MSNLQSRQSVYNYESKGFNEVLKLITLHLIKNAITMLGDKELPPEMEKQRVSIDSDIKEQQMIVERLLDNATPQQATIGGAMACQGFKSPFQFREQLDKQLSDGDVNVKGYQPKRASNSKPLPPPKKP
ncbi:hypothetical protein AB6H27_22640 [Providencia huaxiensis]|uniref:hypothetical protein n=1 Tax=Providencia TaxID=586 RepID=UPI001D0D1638|nr:hypothetical protein [Providencia rettgeri]MCB6144320.1 hypothetical protein [Providencia rettgeri]MCF8965210.1 hypothetical protein [Providencia rettgeri]UDQ68872.1 hypothetical protein LHK11_08320 [Providencia rettgeri]